MYAPHLQYKTMHSKLLLQRLHETEIMHLTCECLTFRAINVVLDWRAQPKRSSIHLIRSTATIAMNVSNLKNKTFKKQNICLQARSEPTFTCHFYHSRSVLPFSTSLACRALTPPRGYIGGPASASHKKEEFGTRVDGTG